MHGRDHGNVPVSPGASSTEAWAICPADTVGLVRRDELESVGIHLPVLATVCAGPLPQPGNWAGRLDRLGIDVITTGAPVDDVVGVEQACALVPHRPVMAMAGDPVALAAAGARVVAMQGVAPTGVYAFRPDEVVVTPIAADAPAENANDVAGAVLAAAREGRASAIWVAAPDLSMVPEDVAEAKLAALTEGARMARMWLAKQQSDPD
jgi:hypothetical protein